MSSKAAGAALAVASVSGRSCPGGGGQTTRTPPATPPGAQGGVNPCPPALPVRPQGRLPDRH